MSRRPARAPRDPPAAPRPPAAPSGLPLGSTGLVHPPVGLGLWALGRWTREDEEKTRRTLDHALERGIPWFDTAEVYGAGRSERLLGDALARTGTAPGTPFISTKVSWEHLAPGQVRSSLVGSLRRLGRREVDLYLVHAPDRRTPIPDTMRALEELWTEGRARAIGVSNFSLDELDAAREALQRAEVVVNQVRFNLLDRSDADPILEYCRGHGIVVEAYTPLARGLLADLPGTRQRSAARLRRVARSLFEDGKVDGVLKRVSALQALARDAQVPLTSIALHWLARQGVAPVFGASSPEQVDRVLAAWAVVPPADVLARADEVARSGP